MYASRSKLLMIAGVCAAPSHPHAVRRVVPSMLSTCTPRCMLPSILTCQRRRFGGGVMAGSVKRVVVTNNATGYKNWFLRQSIIDELASVIPRIHPIVWEYIIRLHEKHRLLLQIQETAVGCVSSPEDLLRERVKNISDPQTPFSYNKWLKMYVHELEETEGVFNVLMLLHKSILMHEELSVDVVENRELIEMCEEEIDQHVTKLQQMEKEVQDVISRRLSAADFVGSSSRTWTIEIVGKAGGTEASLFAEDLIELLKHYAKANHEWKVEPVLGDNMVPDPTKLQITGDEVYRHLRHEIGVHKVQRVPVTEKEGKMQTSTAAFTMMPVLDPIAVNVREEDCTFDFVRGSGPGGQGMQSSSNCCVLTHRPSGISVKCHQSRSALGNKELALQMVAQQILSRRVREQSRSQDVAWANQWTSGERAEKMRTYNWPQNRVTDHRLGRDFPLASYMEGNQEMKQLHDELNQADDRQNLEVVLRKYIDSEFGSDGV